MTTTLRKTPSQRLHGPRSISEEDLSPTSPRSPASVSAASNTDSDDNDNHASPKNIINNDDISPSRSMSSSPGVVLPCSAEAKTLAERLWEKIQALLWVAMATAVGWYLDLPLTLLADPRIHRTPFNIATVLLMINLVLISYLGIYLPKVVGINDSSAWEAYCPRVIPIMTFNGVMCGILAIRSLWPVWGFLTPFILGLEFLGVVFGMHFVPWI